MHDSHYKYTFFIEICVLQKPQSKTSKTTILLDTKKVNSAKSQITLRMPNIFANGQGLS